MKITYYPYNPSKSSVFKCGESFESLFCSIDLMIKCAGCQSMPTTFGQHRRQQRGLVLAGSSNYPSRETWSRWFCNELPLGFHGIQLPCREANKYVYRDSSLMYTYRSIFKYNWMLYCGTLMSKYQKLLLTLHHLSPKQISMRCRWQLDKHCSFVSNGVGWTISEGNITLQKTIGCPQIK